MLERDSVPDDKTLMVLVVGYNRDDLDRQFAAAGAEEQIVKAVAVLGDHDQDSLLSAMTLRAPIHVPLCSHWSEVLSEFFAG